MKDILTAERVDLITDTKISVACDPFDCSCQGCVWDG